MNTDKLGVLFLSLSLMTQAHGQSLGDLARQQRQKQADKSAAQRKVVTDDDLPTHPAESTDAVTKERSGEASSQPINSDSNAEQVKANFVSAKKQIADFKAQLEKLRASVHYVEANRYTNGVQYNQHQQRKEQEADRMQKQLDEAEKKLQSMQEAARKAGFGSSVYDP